MKKEYHKQKQKKSFTPQEKKKIQNEVYTWIIFAMIVFWTVSSILGTIGFARSFKTDVAATAETVAATSVVEEQMGECDSLRAPQGNRTKKIAKINTNLPPATDSTAKIPSMYGFDISIYHWDLIEVNGYTTSYSFPLNYENGIGDRIFEYDDYVPVYMSVSPTSTIYTRYDYRQGFANTDLSVFDIRAEWVLGNTFVNEEWYEHFFGGFALTLGGATSYTFFVMDYYCVFTILKPNHDNGTLEPTRIVYEAQSAGNNRYLEFNAPTWEEFSSMYGYNGYCLISDMAITFSVPTPYFQDYISFTLNHLSTPRNYSEFKELQSTASNTFSIYSYLSGSGDGYNAGYEQGYNVGFNQGVIDANDYSFLSLLTAVVDGPFQVFYDMFNFELLGYNMTSFFLALLSACVVLAVLKVILGR